MEKPINQLQKLPPGLLAPVSWFSAPQRGISRQLLKKYQANGWLESPARGIYRRPGPPLKWQHVVASLQHPELMYLPVIIGGRSALELQGYAHYLRLGGAERIHLYAGEKLPKWLNQLGLRDQFVVHTDTLFASPGRGLTSAEMNVAKDEIVQTDPLRVGMRGGGLREIIWGDWDWTLTHSTVERAMLEVLDDIPRGESFHQADVLMRGLTTLSPRRLTRLLADCRSIKAKRLFFAFAERHNHPWLTELDEASFNLGSGKRALIPGERLHPKYQITWPRALDEHGG